MIDSRYRNYRSHPTWLRNPVVIHRVCRIWIEGTGEKNTGYVQRHHVKRLASLGYKIILEPLSQVAQTTAVLFSR